MKLFFTLAVAALLFFPHSSYSGVTSETRFFNPNWVDQELLRAGTFEQLLSGKVEKIIEVYPLGTEQYRANVVVNVAKVLKDPEPAPEPAENPDVDAKDPDENPADASANGGEPQAPLPFGKSYFAVDSLLDRFRRDRKAERAQTQKMLNDDKAEEKLNPLPGKPTVDYEVQAVQVQVLVDV